MTDRDQRRAAALKDFALLAGLPEIARVEQRGRDPQTTTYTITFAGRQSDPVTVGTIEDLWSRTKLSKVLAVRIGRCVAPVKPADWLEAIAALITHGVDVDERVESFEDDVAGWARSYIDTLATNDPDGAAAQGKPFRDEKGFAYVSAGKLALYIRREHGEQIQLHRLRAALVTLGWKQHTVRYRRGDKQSSTSYYRIRATAIDPEPAE